MPQLKSTSLEVVSTVFRDGSFIPAPYTCKGQNVNPPLNIMGLPEKSQSITLIMHDPDALSGDFLHWLLWDIPPATEVISVNSVPVGAVQGQNGLGRIGYTGPCPPKGSGTHRYIFDFFALDKTLNLASGAKLKQVQEAQKGHIISSFRLIGLFAADN